MPPRPGPAARYRMTCNRRVARCGDTRRPGPQAAAQARRRTACDWRADRARSPPRSRGIRCSCQLLVRALRGQRSKQVPQPAQWGSTWRGPGMLARRQERESGGLASSSGVVVGVGADLAALGGVVVGVGADLAALGGVVVGLGADLAALR